MKKNFLTVLLLSSTVAFSQEKKQRDPYQFAHTYFGIETEFLPQSATFTTLNSGGTFDTKKLPSFGSARFVVGGTHFWDHADFYISIPVLEFALNNSKDASISNGVLTGFRYFPLKIKPNAIRPFIGTGFGGTDFSAKGSEGEGPTDNNRQWYFEGGLSYRYKGSKLFDLGVRYFNNKSYNYANSRTTFEKVDLNQFSIMVSYKRLFDFTQSYGKDEMKKFVAKAHDALEKENGLSTFSFAAGLSYTIPLEPIEFSERTPFLNQEATQNFNLEIGIGYYFHKQDAAVRLSYRPLQQKETAYGYTSELKTNSLAFEAFKFIGNYHGFVPFVGPYVGLNNYNYNEIDRGSEVVDFTENKLAYGLVFGWDIRISDVDYLLLRTNLRFTPDLNYKKKRLSFTNNQIEFNFIQVVFYPERMKITKKLR
ncbi:MAG: outer membrane protein W [Vicingaceae bacterium]|jgi:outer membrane protein W